ncbi:MAG: hypothetical protein ACLRT4_15815 [Thomasclavelia sp.]
MKYRYKLKKDNHSIVGKIILIMIYFSFYLLSIKLFLIYFNFINEIIIILLGLAYFIFISVPLVFTPKWYLTDKAIVIVEPNGIIDKWNYLFFKKGMQIINYSSIANISISYKKTATLYLYDEGYLVLFKIHLNSGDEIIFDSLLPANKDKYLEGISLLENEQIKIIDNYQIIATLKENKISLYDHLKKLETGDFND